MCTNHYVNRAKLGQSCLKRGQLLVPVRDITLERDSFAMVMV